MLKNKNSKRIDNLMFIGVHIDKAIKFLSENHPSYIVFNDVLLESISDNYDENLKYLNDYYSAELKRKSLQFKKSEEGILFEKRKFHELEDAKSNISFFNKELNELDFSNYELLLSWLVKIQPSMSLIGVHNYLDFRQNLLNKFKEFELIPNMCLNEQFDENNKENVAKYIIGQALDGILNVGSPHQIISSFHDKWKNKFVNQ